MANPCETDIVYTRANPYEADRLRAREVFDWARENIDESRRTSMDFSDLTEFVADAYEDAMGMFLSLETCELLHDLLAEEMV